MSVSSYPIKPIQLSAPVTISTGMLLSFWGFEIWPYIIFGLLENVIILKGLMKMMSVLEEGQFNFFLGGSGGKNNKAQMEGCEKCKKTSHH